MPDGGHPIAARVDEPSRALVAALRASGLEDVDDSALTRAMYASDASLYRVPPLAVARPQHVEEILAALDAARASGVPVTARGAGTSIAGNAIGPGLVLDLSRHLTGVGVVDPDARTVRVEPGAVQSSVQAAAAVHGLRFGPDPSTADRCTVGGMIGNNACGSRALAYGRTSDNVVGLDVVTGTGERLSLTAGATDPAGSPTLRALHEIVAGGLGPIRTELGRFPRQVSGYALEHLLPERGFDLARALVGSEGTLALVLGATLRLVVDPPLRALVVLGYPSMADAADVVPDLLAAVAPTACEALDLRLVDAVRRRHGPGRVPTLPRGEGWLLVEVVGDSPTEVRALAQRAIAAAGALDARVLDDPAETAALWRIRTDGAGIASRTADGRPAYAGWEDAAVPVASLGAYLRDFEALVAAHGLTGLPYGHFGDGCVHVRLDFPLERAGGEDELAAFLREAAQLVASYGGSLSGEHGDGRTRSALLPLMYSPEVLEVFGAVKRVLDPGGVLNPGVLVDPAPVTADLRRVAATLPRAAAGLRLAADGGDLAAASHRCIGVGSCRADRTAAGGVMCPSYLATREEKDSTRGRARVLQELADGRLVRGYRAAEVHDALDLCLSCKACSRECPTGVDLAAYKSEVLHQTYRHRLRPRSHYALGQLPRWSRLASRAPRLANAVLAAPRLSAWARRASGLDAHRSLPSFAPTTFRSWFTSTPHAVGDRDVLLWVDTFTDHFTPEVGRAAVAVLEDAGYTVHIPERSVCCGLTWTTTGQLEGARRQLRRTLRALEQPLAQGVPVVGLEPSCTASLRADAVELLGAPARPLAAAVVTLAELLRATPGWTPPDLSGVTVVAQPHCHHRAVLTWDADAALLAAGGADVTAVGGCCGMAGNFGMERGHADVSVAVAENALLPAVRASAPGTTVLADGFSCRTQLQDLGGVRGRHLAELLHDPPSG